MPGAVAPIRAAATGPAVAAFDVEAPRAPPPPGRAPPLRALRGEAWRDAEDVGALITWAGATAVDIALAVVLLSYEPTAWLGLLALLFLLAPLVTTAALVLARNHWLAVALRYVAGVLLMRSSSGLRLRCLARARALQAAVAWAGLLLLAAVGLIVAVYLGTCYSVTALLSVPILDLTMVLASVPALRRHVLRPDLVFLESYRQARYLGVALLQSLPMIGLAALLATAHAQGSAAGFTYQGIGFARPARGPAAHMGAGGTGGLSVDPQALAARPGARALLQGAPVGGPQAAQQQQQQQQGQQQPLAAVLPWPFILTPRAASAPGGAGGAGGSAAAGAGPQLDLSALISAAAQALAATGAVFQAPAAAAAPPPPATPPPAAAQEPPPAGRPPPPPPASWAGVCAAVATAVPLPLLALVLAAAALNAASKIALLYNACAAAGVPPLRHAWHVARMRGGLRVLAPIADEALKVMADRDDDDCWALGGGGCECEGECCCDCGGAGCGAEGKAAAAAGDGGGEAPGGGGGGAGGSQGGASDAGSGGAPGAGAAPSGGVTPGGGLRLLVSSAWHWGSSPDGPDAWLPLVPRYLLPTDGGWLGPGQMARLAVLAFERYGCGGGGGGGGGGAAAAAGSSTDAAAGGGASGDASVGLGGAAAGGGAASGTGACACACAGSGCAPVTGLELEHLEGAELRSVLARGLAALPHARRLHLRWCRLDGRSLRPVLPVLRAHPSLLSLTLERCEVDDGAAGLIKQLLAGCTGGGGGPAGGASAGGPAPRLRVLRLVRCGLSEAAARALADGLAASRALRGFVFSGNAIEPSAGRTAAAAAFARALRRGASGLRHLTLGFSRGCPATAEALAAAVAAGEAPAGLAAVVLHRREVSPRGLQAWADALARAGGAAAVPAELTLRAAPPAPPPRARDSNSGGSGGGSDSNGGGESSGNGNGSGAAAAAGPRSGGAGGRAPPRQSLLFVEQLPITFVIDADHDAVFRHDWLAALPPANFAPSNASASASGSAHASGRGGRPQLVVLSPGDTGETVVTALKGLPLSAVDLSGVHLGARGGRAVAAALPLAPSLRSADLSSCGLGDDAAAALAAALPGCGALRELALGGNCVADRGAAALLAALEGGVCPSLRLLSLRGNRFPLEWETLLRVRAAAAARPGLRLELLPPPAAGAAARAAAGAPGAACSAEALSRLLSAPPAAAPDAATAATTATAVSTSAGARHARGASGGDWSVSSDDVCGVCFDRPNSLHVSPCAHALCVPCYRRVLRASGAAPGAAGAPSCPFCRGRIEGFAYAAWVQRAAEEHLVAAVGGGGGSAGDAAAAGAGAGGGGNAPAGGAPAGGGDAAAAAAGEGGGSAAAAAAGAGAAPAADALDARAP